MADEVIKLALVSAARCAMICIATVKHIYASEAYPTKMRATGLGMVHFWTRVAAIIAPFFANLVYAMDSTLCIASFSAAYFVVALASSLLPFDTLNRIMM